MFTVFDLLTDTLAVVTGGFKQTIFVPGSLEQNTLLIVEHTEDTRSKTLTFSTPIVP